MNLIERLKLRARFRWLGPRRVDRVPSFNLSHSQFGEDMLLRAILGDRRQGSFVDIGAHHPVYYSNTYHFYRRGWRGLNVDAAPGSMESFKVLRPADVNIEAAIGPRTGEAATFFVIDPPACSTMDRATATRLVESGQAPIVREVAVQTLTLADCLARHFRGPAEFDLLNIDVEGLDAAILQSNDWAKWRPRVVVFEAHDVQDLHQLSENQSVRLLESLDYRPAGKCGPSIIMQRKSDLRSSM